MIQVDLGSILGRFGADPRSIQGRSRFDPGLIGGGFGVDPDSIWGRSRVDEAKNNLL